MGDENETYYFKSKYIFYLRTGGVKSHLIEDGAHNKNYSTLSQGFVQKHLTPSFN